MPLPLEGGKPLMYGRMSCPYTVKMVDALKEESLFEIFEFIDTDSDEGSALFKASGGEGVPHFEHNDKYATGYMKPSALLKKLNIA